MASYVRCLCFFFTLSLFSFHQTLARDSKLFSKFSHKPTSENTKEVSSSIESRAPALESEVVERGYGLYGKENYRYPPTTTDPVKTGALVGGEKFVSMEEIRNEMRNGNGNTNGYVSTKQGMSDTRFLENGKYYYDINEDAKDENRYTGNGYETEKMGVIEHIEDENSYPGSNGNGNGNGSEFVTEKQGMSDTRFLENGRYYYDINQDVKDENRYKGNGYATEKQGMSEHEEGENSYHENQGNGYRYGNEYVTEKQGMSDLENRRYHYGINQDVKNEDNYPKSRRNSNGNGHVTERQGMSDTRFLENGKYFYDINAEAAKGETGYANEYNNGNEYFDEEMNQNYEKSNNHYNNNNYENEGFLNKKNVYKNGYNENEHYEGDNGQETQGRRGHNYNPNEYVTQGGENYHGNTKNLPPNQYDAMEEYEKEEEYRLSHQYVP